MPVQTSYTQTMAAGLPGALANGEDFNAISRTVATAAIPFGSPAARSGTFGCVPFVKGSEFLGIVRRDMKSTTTNDTQAVGETAGLITKGVFYATSDAAFAAGVALNFNTATNRYTTAATSATVLAVPGLEADEAATAAGQNVKLRLVRVPS